MDHLGSSCDPHALGSRRYPSSFTLRVGRSRTPGHHIVRDCNRLFVAWLDAPLGRCVLLLIAIGLSFASAPLWGRQYGASLIVAVAALWASAGSSVRSAWLPRLPAVGRLGSAVEAHPGTGPPPRRALIARGYDSPFTYFTSDELTAVRSRGNALVREPAARALWLTLKPCYSNARPSAPRQQHDS